MQEEKEGVRQFVPCKPCQELDLYSSMLREWKRKSQYTSLVQRKQPVAEGGFVPKYILGSSYSEYPMFQGPGKRGYNQILCHWNLGEILREHEHIQTWVTATTAAQRKFPRNTT